MVKHWVTSGVFYPPIMFGIGTMFRTHRVLRRFLVCLFIVVHFLSTPAFVLLRVWADAVPLSTYISCKGFFVLCFYFLSGWDIVLSWTIFTVASFFFFFPFISHLVRQLQTKAVTLYCVRLLFNEQIGCHSVGSVLWCCGEVGGVQVEYRYCGYSTVLQLDLALLAELE